MAVTRIRHDTRRLAIVVFAVALSSAVWLAAAGPTVACSCAMPGSLAEYDTPTNAIFSGSAGPLDARGVPVRVEMWYSGTGAAPIVYLARQSFGDGAACGINPPIAGTRSIWVTWVPEGGGDPTTGLCSPHADIGTPDGDAMVKEATALFGGTAPPGTSTDPPEATSTPIVPVDAGGPIVLLTVGLGLGVFLVAVLLARRRSGSA